MFRFYKHFQHSGSARRLSIIIMYTIVFVKSLQLKFYVFLVPCNIFYVIFILFLYWYIISHFKRLRS